MRNERRSILTTLQRSLRLRCPVCGKSSINRIPFKIRHHCPTCNSLFMREDGFFVGAILINVVTTELFILAVYVVCVVGFSTDYELMLSILFVAAIVFPVAFYHHSWSFWLGLDHVIESLPQNASSAGIDSKEEWPDRIDA